MSNLIFIDTNIMLDFYRYPQGTAVLPLLKHIDKNHDRIITGNQIEMEYKKNRQKVILKSIGDLKKPNWESLKVPVIVSETQSTQIMDRDKKNINKQLAKLKKKIEQILKNPIKNDMVYQTLQRLFRSNSLINLTRDNEIRFQVRELAKKRFELGYPPRKSADTSIGDPVNWEWIIYCAKQRNSNVIIVSRDSDYGHTYNQEQYINDWLSQEFKDRVNRRKKVTLTNKLTTAFKTASIKVSEKEVKDESQLVDDISSDIRSSFKFPDLSSSFDPITKEYTEFQKEMKKMMEPFAKLQKELQDQFNKGNE